jgi:hypothetical protein
LARKSFSFLAVECPRDAIKRDKATQPLIREARLADAIGIIKAARARTKARRLYWTSRPAPAAPLDVTATLARSTRAARHISHIHGVSR